MDQALTTLAEIMIVAVIFLMMGKAWREKEEEAKGVWLRVRSAGPGREARQSPVPGGRHRRIRRRQSRPWCRGRGAGPEPARASRTGKQNRR